MYRGVALLLLLISTLAPLPTNVTTASKHPPTTAKCSGEWPSSSWDSKSPPNSIIIESTSLWPFMAATCMAVRPY
ncbi:hypothetical protein TorRG33x02_327980 [Trema orientale]|uniref:Secreted protein n=1 Tax=Trema orientale TaxID=63057 RepID=A0A2P5BAB4_TREOI|nr:hypothetical protein TorRG33x02_327980 [Trema orientale]